ncbi:MAG TPA: septal ring lytic transglycosylase RlpA family protein [Polyangia bacterium]|nr:septal ring lytic transglycosylase RlpA family protein [Polyangia bacterium]
MPPYRISLLLGLALALSACGTTPAPPPSTVPRPTPAPAPVPAHGGQVGMATYYANRFAGRKTASGERYNPRELTAAHKTLPLGTIVRVTRVDGEGEVVTVRINDRGPYAAGRIIDLSMAAARRLRMLQDGVVRVRVEVISRPDR